MTMKSCSRLSQFDPLYEILDELPDVDVHHHGRYVYITPDDTFYVLSHGGWLPLGVKLPVNQQHVQLKLTDDISAVKSENIPCWSDDYVSNVQLTIYDFQLDIRSAKKAEQLGNTSIDNFHIDIYGFNKVSSTTLLLTDTIGANIPANSTSSKALNYLADKSDTKLFLNEDTISGKYLGDPCFTVADSLVLDANFLSILSGDDIQASFFDSSSNIQFVIDNIDYKWNNSGFTTLTGAPRMFTNIQSGEGISSTEPVDFLRIGSDDDEYEYIEFNSIYDIWEQYVPDTIDRWEIDCGEFVWKKLNDEIQAESFSHCPAHMVSVDLYDEFVLDIIIGSPDEEGEPIYTVIAHTEYLGVIHTLSAVRHVGAVVKRWHDDLSTTDMFSIVYDIGLTTQQVLVQTDNVNSLNPGWNGQYSRIYVKRTGNEIIAITSVLDKYGLNYGTSLSININSYQVLQKFKGPQRIGFGTQSQASAWVKDPAVFLRDAAGHAASPYLRGNGVDWTKFNMVTADEIYAPLTSCFDDCECEDPDANTTALQQTICQLFKNVFSCKDYIRFEHFIDTDEEVNMLMPMGLEDPDDPESPMVPVDPVARIIYDIRTDDVWVYNCGVWMIDECRTVCKLEKNRMYFNTVTRKLFYLACDCSVYALLTFTLPEGSCA